MRKEKKNVETILKYCTFWHSLKKEQKYIENITDIFILSKSDKPVKYLSYLHFIRKEKKNVKTITNIFAFMQENDKSIEIFPFWNFLGKRRNTLTINWYFLFYARKNNLLN